MQKQDSICWLCENACGKCPWSDKTFTPVPGWKATPTKIKYFEGCYTDSFIVHSCPMFVKTDTGLEDITCTELGKLLSINRRTISNRKLKELKQLCFEKGFELHATYNSGKRYFSIKQINKDSSYYMFPEIAKLFGLNVADSEF